MRKNVHPCIKKGCYLMRTEYMNRLVEQIRRSDFDAVLLCPSEELLFFAGFSPMMCERFQGLFVKEDGTMFYFCNLLYADELRLELPEDVPVYPWFDGDYMTDVMRDVLEKEGLLGKVIGVNSSAQAFNVLEIMDKVNVTFRNAKPLLEETRVVKSHEELENLRHSAWIADQVFEKAMHFIKPGMTEGEIGDFLMREMIALGGETPENIVAVGSNASYPHYSGNSRVVGEQDLVLMDFGCTYNGMYSDISRTVFVGDVTDEQRRIYEIVDEANAAAEAAAVEGAWIPDIDQAARDVLAKYGYAETLVNRVGHGIGYMVHEAPDIKKSDERRLERGMAFTIEPGIYIGGKVGMRIEDVVVINENGEREVLNKAPRELIVIR